MLSLEGPCLQLLAPLSPLKPPVFQSLYVLSCQHLEDQFVCIFRA